MIELSSFERRVLTKPCVVVDASIILASGVEGFSFQIQCAKYLNQANKTYQPFITKPIMGELFRELTRIKDLNLAHSAFQFTKEILTEFNYVPHMHLHQSDIDILKDKFSIIMPDDRLHLAHVCAANRYWVKKKDLSSDLRFATIDNKIIDLDMIRRLKSRLGLDIINPLSLSL